MLRLFLAFMVFGYIAKLVLKQMAERGWNSPLQAMLMNFVLMPLFLAFLAWVIRARPVKGMILFLLIADFVVFSMAVSALLGSNLWRFHQQYFGIQTTFAVDHCQPLGAEAACTGRVLGGGVDSAGLVTIQLSHMYAPGEIVQGVGYDGGFGSGGFAENGKLPDRPPLLRSGIVAAALLVVTVWVWRSLWRSFKAPRGAAVWDPAGSILRKRFVEAFFRWAGLAAVIVVALLCAYLLMEQLGPQGGEDVRRVLGLSAGDWMTVDGLLVGLVTWGFRKTKTLFAQAVIVTASRVSVFGIVLCFVVLLLEQASSVWSRFIVVGDETAWSTLHELDHLREAFDPPMLLATAALLVAVYLMTLQLFEVNDDESKASAETWPELTQPSGQLPHTLTPELDQEDSPGPISR